MAQRSGGQVGESSMRRSYRLLGGYSGMHQAPPLARHYKTTRGRAVREASAWVRPTYGVGRSRGGPHRAGFRPGDCHVGPKVGMGLFAVFLDRYLMVAGHWIHVLALDWSRVCFFGSLRCHGHMSACVAACRLVAWCGSHQVHMMSCAYFFHRGSDV
jgi:hypothetical protein